MIETGKCFCCHKVNPDPAGERRVLQKAAAVLRKLRATKGWTIQAHHSIVWYSSLRNGPLRLDWSRDRYCCMLSFTHPGGGDDDWFDPCISYKDPNRAITKQLSLVRQHIYKQMRQWQSLEKNLGPWMKKGG
jgi:hypothetical protein